MARDEILESYLAGRLNEEDRDAFEAHYFECARCFGELQILHAIRSELQRGGDRFDAARGTRPSFRWAAAATLAATIAVALGAALWTRSSRPSNPTEIAQTVPATDVLPTEKAQPENLLPTMASEPALEQLARFDPPKYEPLTLRGAPDEATARFQRGMEQYRKADYQQAVVDLGAAAESDPSAPHIRFFLGIAHLLLGQDNAAITQLREAIALGDSAYLEEARWYLAKAYLRRKNLAAAETELKELIQLRGSGSGEARQLLTQLERFKQRETP